MTLMRGRGSYSGSHGGSYGRQQSFGRDPNAVPDYVQPMGTFMHATESEMVCQSTNSSHVPYFNAFVYLENKSQIGKVDEILGPINQVYFTVKMNAGMQASSFKAGDTVYIAGDKLLPIDRFLPKPKAAKKKTFGGGDRGARGGMRGGRGGMRGGMRGASRGSFRGAPRGASRGRGGFSARGR